VVQTLPLQRTSAFKFGILSKLPILVSECMENGALPDYTKRGRFDAHETCKIIYGIASGLHCILHEHCMVHADLKGSNILVSNSGEPMLADFGLSVSSTSTSLSATTCHGEKGLLRWMAKELRINSSQISDIPKHTMMTDM